MKSGVKKNGLNRKNQCLQLNVNNVWFKPVVLKVLAHKLIDWVEQKLIAFFIKMFVEKILLLRLVLFNVLFVNIRH